MKKLTVENKMSLQFWLGVVIVLLGMVLLFLGFYAIPIGEISPSVLTAFGEAATFSGALIGVDYNYKFKVFREEERHRKNNEEDYD